MQRTVGYSPESEILIIIIIILITVNTGILIIIIRGFSLLAEHSFKHGQQSVRQGNQNYSQGAGLQSYSPGTELQPGSRPGVQRATEQKRCAVMCNRSY